MQLGTSVSPAADSCLVYNYYVGVSNPTSCAIPSQAASGDNRNEVGNFFQDTTNPSLGHTASYDYDTLNRLTNSVATGSATHNLTFSYDRYGNMTCQTNGQTNGPCPSYSFSSSTNRITNSSFTYDAAGNLTQNGTGTGTHTFQWDAEGRMSSVDNGTTASYTYNALGHRVEKNASGTYTEYAFDTSGEPIGENNRTSWTGEFFDFQGRHLVHYQNNAAYFVHANTVGSTGQVTDYTGSLAQDQLHYPWGQDWAMVGSMQEERFARLRHRDTEANLDPTQFRMFSSDQGRWLSPDRVQGRPCTPQSLDRYAYVENSPTNHTDRLGDQYSCDPEQNPCCDQYFRESNAECGLPYPSPPIIVIVAAPPPPPPPPPPAPASSVSPCTCSSPFPGVWRWTGCTYSCQCSNYATGNVTFSCNVWDKYAWSSCPGELTGCHTPGPSGVPNSIWCPDFCN